MIQTHAHARTASVWMVAERAHPFVLHLGFPTPNEFHAADVNAIGRVMHRLVVLITASPPHPYADCAGRSFNWCG